MKPIQQVATRFLFIEMVRQERKDQCNVNKEGIWFYENFALICICMYMYKLKLKCVALCNDIKCTGDCELSLKDNF